MTRHVPPRSLTALQDQLLKADPLSPIPHTITPDMICHLRRDLGMTQLEFAQELGLSRGGTISSWERGVAQPTPESTHHLRLLYAARACVERARVREATLKRPGHH